MRKAKIGIKNDSVYYTLQVMIYIKRPRKTLRKEVVSLGLFTKNDTLKIHMSQNYKVGFCYALKLCPQS